MWPRNFWKFFFYLFQLCSDSKLEYEIHLILNYGHVIMQRNLVFAYSVLFFYFKWLQSWSKWHIVCHTVCHVSLLSRNAAHSLVQWMMSSCTIQIFPVSHFQGNHHGIRGFYLDSQRGLCQLSHPPTPNGISSLRSIRSQAWLYAIALCLCNVFQVMIKDAVPSYKKRWPVSQITMTRLQTRSKAKRCFWKSACRLTRCVFFHMRSPGWKKGCVLLVRCGLMCARWSALHVVCLARSKLSLGRMRVL